MPQTRLLLAEDDADHRRLLLMALASARPTLDVLATSSRDEFLAAARTGRFDCMVLDYNLPPHTAPEIIREVRPILPDTPIVVVSSSDDQRVVIEALRVGVGDFVPKDEAIVGDALWKHIERAIAAARSGLADRRRGERRLQSAKKLAETDALTGLLNRRYAERALSAPRTRADRRAAVSGVMIDIDFFKRINDGHGHAVGDEVLRRVARAIAACAGPQDRVIRWGGEEFFVLKPGADLAEAAVWSARAGREIATGSTDAACPRVTASFGVATVPMGELSAGLAGLADRALYLAKDLGRNRVCTWPMVVAMDAALEIGLVGTTVEAPARRAERLLRRLADSLGTVQREHTGPHSERVRVLTHALARAWRLSGEVLEDLELAAAVHDLGKIGVPEELLAKPGALTPDEKRVVDEHASFGAELTRALGLSERATRIVACHHDRYDRPRSDAAFEARGSGNDPPLTAILTVADAVVTMLSARSYARQRTPAQMLAELRHERGRQFDPDVVDAVHFIDRGMLAA